MRLTGLMASIVLTIGTTFAAEVTEIVPAVDQRLAENTISRVDLREIDRVNVAEIEAEITTRLYGPRGPRNALTFVTDFAQDGLIAFDVRAASAGGATLMVEGAGGLRMQCWRGQETIQVGETFAVPVPAGLQETTLRATSGTVVIDRYSIYADANDAPQEVRIVPQMSALNQKADGYRGIWYYNQPLDNEYVYKYSGGLGTYCAKHLPFAVYAPEARKTFFVYGGTDEENSTLLMMVSYYDHETGQVPRPTVLWDKQTTDAHDNPVISLSEDGHIWVFASSHGTSRPSYIFRSREPYAIDDFELVSITNFSYPQVHQIPNHGFFFLQTLYHGGRVLHFQTSEDGREWTEPVRIAAIDQGHYQVSDSYGTKVGSAFNYHPEPQGLNWRTNLYYVETTDMGQSWHNAAGEDLKLPLTEVQNGALVRDYEAEGLKVYMKDMVFDAEGRPVVLYITSPGFESGPENSPRTWTVAHWLGSRWRFSEITTSDSNYDTGSLYIDEETWTLVAPTETGPQPYNPGGEVAMWRSEDAGQTWRMVRQMTRDSRFNHTYVRRPENWHPDFMAFWADGHGRQPSKSRLYFSDSEGNVVRLPWTMEGEMATPRRLDYGE